MKLELELEVNRKNQILATKSWMLNCVNRRRLWRLTILGEDMIIEDELSVDGGQVLLYKSIATSVIEPQIISEVKQSWTQQPFFATSELQSPCDQCG